MLAKDIIQNYYKCLEEKGDWESFFSDSMIFINNGKKMREKDTYLEGIKRFFSMVKSFDILERVLEEDKGGAVVRYHLNAPNGTTFISEVAEFFHIKNEKFELFAIFFDTAPYPPR